MINKILLDALSVLNKLYFPIQVSIVYLIVKNKTKMIPLNVTLLPKIMFQSLVLLYYKLRRLKIMKKLTNALLMM